MKKDSNVDLVGVVDIYDYDRLVREPVFFAGYNQQVATAKSITLYSLQKKTMFVNLVFGLPGTGKGIFPLYIAHKIAKEHDFRLKFLKICVDKWLINEKKAFDVVNGLLSEISTLKRNLGILLELENIESLAARRLRDLPSLASVIASFLDDIYRLSSKRKIGSTVFLSTSFPNKVDEAILHRVHYVIYLHPSGTDEIKEILRHYKVPEPERVAEALITQLEGKLVSGNGLINACENIKKLHIKYDRDIWKNANLLMANAILAQSTESIAEYEARNEFFIKKSEATIKFWSAQSQEIKT